MPDPNPEIVDTATPPIPEAVAWTRDYDGGRGPLIDLSQAVPGYPPHGDLLNGLAAAAGSPEAARYGDILGDAPLREVYAEHMSQTYGAQVASDDIVVTAGCNQAFFVAMLTVARAGDAVILPAPWYFNHKMTLDMLGIEAAALPCLAEDGFAPDPAAAEALIDARTRAIVLVTPNNPTGAIYPPRTVAAFRDLCRRRGLWLIVDETYRDFAGDDAPHDLFADAGWREDVVSLYSFSKAYCIPGHRLGAIAAGPEFAAQAAKVMDSLQICAPRPGQMALVAAIPALAAWRGANRREIADRAAGFARAVEAIGDWRIDAIGAYFAYLRHPFEGVPAGEIARLLAAGRGVLCLPGPYFGPGQERHLRVAFANVAATTIAGLSDRLRGFAA